jgi:hypothetical protein
MSKRLIDPMFFAEDRDIFDLLESSKQRFTENTLREVAQKRGLFFSEEAPRDFLVEQIARLNHSLSDIEQFVLMSDTHDRSDELHSQFLSGKMKRDDIVAAFEHVKKGRDRLREEIKIEPRPKRVVVTVSYNEIDHAKTRLVQVVVRQLVMTVDLTSDEEWRIRHDSSARAFEIASDVASYLEKKNSVRSSTITLSGIHSASLRTKFFVDMARGVPGFDLINVTRVGVQRMERASTPVVKLDGLVLGDSGAPPDEDAIKSAVNSVQLRGTRLEDTDEYKNLIGKDYYVSMMSWVGQHRTEAQRVEFSARFHRKETASELLYSVGKSYAFIQRHNRHQSTPHQINVVQRSTLLDAMETAARTSLDSVKANSTGGKPQSAASAGAS